MLPVPPDAGAWVVIDATCPFDQVGSGCGPDDGFSMVVTWLDVLSVNVCDSPFWSVISVSCPAELKS